MIEESGIFATELGRNDISTLWNLSIQTQVDELHSERHMQMHFPEFIEAVCRVADRAIIPNFFRDGSEFKNFEDFVIHGPTSPHYQKYKARALHEKIEAFLILLGKQCLDKIWHLMQISQLKLMIENGLKSNDIAFQAIK